MQPISTNQSAAYFQITHTAGPTHLSTNSAFHLPLLPRAFQSISQFFSTCFITLPHSNSLIVSRACAANNTHLPINLHSQWSPYSSLCPPHFISIITIALAMNVIMARKSYTLNISLWPLSVLQKNFKRSLLSFSTNLLIPWQFFHPSRVLTREWDPEELFSMCMVAKFTQFKQWEPGGNFLTTLANSLQFKKWDPGKFVIPSIFLQP